METGTFGGEEDDDVLFDDMVDEYDDEDEAIDAVSGDVMFTPLIDMAQGFVWMIN